MIIRKLLIIFLLLTYVALYSQVENILVPASVTMDLNSAVSLVQIENDRQPFPIQDNKGPTRAGYTLPYPSNISNDGWVETKSGFIWILELYVPDAKAINLYIHNLNLIQSSHLFIYDPALSTIHEIKDIGNPTVCSDFIFGDRIIIELNTSSMPDVFPFQIDEVGILVSDITRGFGDAGDCEVTINCKEGESWQQEKNGVARVLVKDGTSTFWCSGSLINNTKNNGESLFLTANHCGEGADSIDYSKWLFYFNFESEFCGEPPVEPEYNTISGSYLLAKSKTGTNNSSDFKLLKLAQSIPPEYKPYYNGWDRNNISSQTGVTIHHPQGDLKMISTYTQPLVSTRYDNINDNPDGEYWMVYWDETVSGHGVTEGGSSGSPLFNSDGNIVGALTGGRASCSSVNQPDFYGKLSYSWRPDPDSSSNMAYWLDPIGSGVTILKGTNLDSSNIYAGFSAEKKTIIVGESVSFINTSFGNISSYEWFFEGGNPHYSELEEPQSIQYNVAGHYDVTLIAHTAEKSDTLTINNYINVMPSLSPNPTKGEIKLAFGGTVPDDYTIRAFNSIGMETGYRLIEKGENYILIKMYTKTKGAYIIKLISNDIVTTYKVIVTGD